MQRGGELDAYGQAGYLWGSGMNAADLEASLFYALRRNDGNFFLHDLMLFQGARNTPGFQQDFEWREMGKTRQGTTVTTLVSGITTASVVVKTGRTFVYHQPNEVLNQTNGITAIVTAAVLDAGEEQLTLAKRDGTVWATGEIAVGRNLGNSHNAWGEKTGQPDARTWRPASKMNKYTIVKATADFSGDALTTKAEIELPGGSAWVYENQKITCYEFFRDRENALMLAEESPAGAAVNQGRGIVRDIEANSTAFTTYTGAADEADLQAQMLLFNVLSAGNEFILAAGQDLFYDTQRALKDYFLDGSVMYGNFAARKNLAVGFGISQYKFGSKLVDLMEYRGFNDVDVMGATPAGASATETDYKKFGLFLNMGDSQMTDFETGSTIPYFSIKYKALNGVDRSLVTGQLKGMTGLAHTYNGGGLNVSEKPDLGITSALMGGNQVATDIDGEKFFMLSQMGPRLMGVAYNHGYMRAIG